MKYYLIAGEASGDLHGSNLMKALLERDSKAHFRYWGGDRMARMGGEQVMHYRDIAYMGFWEVLKNLRTILQNIRKCKTDILDYDPDALIFIDYPGFNMRIAKWAKGQGIRARSIYYISPQIWAWKEGRANVLRDVLDEMYVILPFEKDFYKKYNFDVKYVGHPLLDHLAQLDFPESLRTKYELNSRPIIALLPGSREQEVRNLLEVMLVMVPTFPDYQFVVAGVTTVSESLYARAKNLENVKVIMDDTNLLLLDAEAALVASGTAALETALMDVPLVVCYRGSALTYQIGRHLVKVQYISLVNIILGRLLVEELIQNAFTVESLRAALYKILTPSVSKEIRAGYSELRQLLGTSGASDRVADDIIQTLASSSRQAS